MNAHASLHLRRTALDRWADRANPTPAEYSARLRELVAWAEANGLGGSPDLDRLPKVRPAGWLYR